MVEERPLVRAGLIGRSIQLSRTPAMHMREGQALGLDYRYSILDLDLIPGGEDALQSLLTRIEGEGFAGVNITHPCKQRVIDFVTELSSDAEEIGAVNTVTFEQGERVGRNTDWWGYFEAFRRGLPEVLLDRVFLLGAGGAGAAVAFALKQLGVREVLLSDVSQLRAEALAERMNAESENTRFRISANLSEDVPKCDGIVHATPTGMLKYPGIALDPNLLSERHWVSEIVYVPLETELVRNARRAGCRTLDGSGMAVFQAVRAFELFTGQPADPERMHLHFKQIGDAQAGSRL